MDVETVAEIASKPGECYYFHDRALKNFYYVGGSFAAPSGAYTTDGGDVVTLSGKTYAIYPMGNGASAHGSAFTIVETSSKEVVAEEKNSVASVAYYQSLVFEKVSETKANIYQYYAGGKVAMYTLEVPGDLTGIESVGAEDVEAPVMESPFPDYTYEPLDKLGEIGVLIFGGLITLVLGLGIGYALKKSD